MIVIDTLLQHDEERYIACRLNGLEMTYTFSDDPKYHHVAILREAGGYDQLKRELNAIYNSYENKEEGYEMACVSMSSIDCIKYFVEDSRYCYSDIRDREEIEEYLDEAFDKVWLIRNCDIPRRRVVNEISRPGMLRILETYDDIPENGYDNWGCGYWNGIMAALRWVLGDEKDFLDT